ncbi:MAG: hypothetical protein AAGU06_02655 [Candidatus Shapirobacteria bacterium]
MAFFNKRLNASRFLLDFIFWAILSLLVTRFFLNITDYPVIGRGIWHISHVLLGGFLMLIGILFLLTSFGKRIRHFSGIICGIGWGLFIDEIGKYITLDNNYLFRPAIIFIYLSFILLFIIYRLLEKTEIKSTLSLWHELFENFEEIIDHDLEKREKEYILKLISQLEKRHLALPKRQLLNQIKKITLSTPSKNDHYSFQLDTITRSSLQFSYRTFFKKKFVFYTLFLYSLWYIIDRIYDAFNLFFNTNRLAILQRYYSNFDFFSKTEVYMLSSKIVVEFVIALFFIIALYWLIKKKTIRSIRYFQNGLLLNIFIGSFLKFYFEQFSAIFGLILTIIVWYWLDRYRQEKIASTSH